MEDKKQDVNVLEELSKAADEFRKWAVDFGDKLSKVLADIQTSKKEEDTWEMKCPYEYNDAYYWLSNNGNVDKCFFNTEIVDKPRFYQGNIFKTRQAASLESKRRNLMTRFRAFRDECNGDWKVDWKNHSDRKYYISFVGKAKLTIFYTGTTNNFQLFGFFKNEQDVQRAIDLFGDEIKRLYVEVE